MHLRDSSTLARWGLDVCFQKEKELMMANWLEDLTKTMADDKLPRRHVLRRMAGSVTSMVVASLLPTQALAKADHLQKHCTGPCRMCACAPPSCSPNPNCFCFLGIGGKGVCGCNTYCSQAPICSKSSDCQKGFACITVNGCTGCGNSYGVCVPYCVGKHKNCQLGDGHGMTATGRVV